MTESPREALVRLSGQLLDPEATYGSMLAATEALFGLFSNLAGLDATAAGAREHRHLSSGKAIGTLWAGMCLNEILRTRRFLLGIHNALEVLIRRFPERPLRIAYAGTGPFATLLLPLIGLWSPDKVQFTLMDINKESLACLQRVVDGLNARPWVADIICCDATTYQFEPEARPHLIVSETMLHALKNEPQVSIALNLAPQLLSGGVFIPQNIVVDAGLFHTRRWMENNMAPDPDRPSVQRLGTAFQLDTRNLPVPERRDGSLAWFPQTAISVPAAREEGFNRLQLFTGIQVFEDIWLRDWECSLNLPEPVLNELPKDAFEMRFHYEISKKPGLRWEVGMY